AATDPDGDPLVYWADRLPPGAFFEAATHTLHWTPGAGSAGTYPGVSFVVSDGLHRVSQSTTLAIAAVNQPPTLARPANRTVREGDPLRIQLSASDPEHDPLTFSSEQLPGGATLDPQTGLFEWTPSFTQDGTYALTFTASDGQLTASQTTLITVLDVQAAPR